MNYPKLPSFRLDNKNALITGAGRGIGMGASIALAESGANVTLVSRTKNELVELTNHITSQGYKASYIVLDVNNEKEVVEMINSSDPFDILINNAGTNRPAKLIDTDINDFDHVMSLNVRSVVNLTKQVVAKMLKNNLKGSIINVSSQMGHVGGPNRTTYCASKFAIEGFTKSLSLELGPEGIRVNTICPTFIQTPMTEPFLKDDQFKKTTLGMIPLGRLGEISDLMGGFVFLASEASSLMTGSSLIIDGGWTAR
ncbi:SDR family NAD(P)-dependent oxidoreductase [Alphaproteobacteria bacterium]|jgi:NAD(P)-dependent dehydrogenase (short-subunit alcohol dehydrogenase family)|nr:SDR family NAD(P)-dependent oxidoreductase [Alphaproteobacteria bacterium]|tara:strand:+ start:489 stop:1253 length:765 start_codon:yes stop_codon:yes gene_type:complete